MNKKLLISLLLLTQVLMLSACSQASFLRDRAQDYKTAKECSGLQIPKGMCVETFSDTYDVPK